MRATMDDKYILIDKIPKAEPNTIKWARWIENSERRVANDLIDNRFRVSTVFLGLDHRFGSDGEPILFETMIFDQKAKHKWNEIYMKRYCTWEEAETGHKLALEKLAKGEIQPDGV